MAEQHDGTDGINWAAFLARQDMTWEGFPAHWHEGAFLGNGLVGAVIYSDPAGLRWDMSRSDITEYSVMKRHHREPSGRMVLRPVGAVRGGEMRLDLWNAEARGSVRTDRGEIRWRSFVHSDEPLLVVETETTGDEAGFLWAWEEERVDWSTVYPNQPPLEKPQPEPQREQQGSVALWSRAFIEGGEQAAAWREIRIADHRRVLYLSLACTRPEPMARLLAPETVNRAAAGGLEPLLATHREWWHRFYPRSFISIPDARAEAFYWAQIYKLGSATRADRPAIDNLGPWWMKQAWPAIWWNLNIQLSYSPVYAANRLGLGESLCRLLDRGLPNLVRNVPEKHQAECAAVGRTTSYDCNSLWAGPVPESGKELCNLPYACHNYWQQYRHSMDDEMLRDRLFPLLRRSINFYLALLKADEQGRLHLPEAISPEYRPSASDTNIDLALLRWGCRALLESCERLKLDDPLIPRWRETLEKLVDPPTNEHGLMIGRGLPLANSHRHHSHLFAIYPLHLLTGATATERALMAKSFDHWINLKGMHAGYSYALAAAFCATLGRSEAAANFLNAFLDRYPTANTMYLETAPKDSGMEDGALIETPLAAANSIQEMLLQSWGGVIRVFPAVPTDWPDAAFQHLRAEGAFLVTAARRSGRTQFVRVTSLAGDPCRVRADLELPVKVIADRDVALDFLPDGSIQVDLRKGETATICASADQPVLIEPVAMPAEEQNAYGSRKARPIRARRDGSFHLLAALARIDGGPVRFEQGGRRNHLTGWTAKGAVARWELMTEGAGAYRVELHYACPPDQVGSVYGFNIGGVTLTGRVREAQGTVWESYAPVDLGTLRLAAAGPHVAVFRIFAVSKASALDLHQIRLVPIRKHPHGEGE